MHNKEIYRQWQVLQSLITKSSAACGGDVELQSHWAKYICVLSAGLLENALQEIYSDYARSCTPEPIANFVVSKLHGISNPLTQRFIEVAANFKPAWRDDLTAFVKSDGREEAIDTIMRNRHLIAHGRSNSNISLVQVKNYLLKSYEVIEFMALP
jgi:hypothetical protein